MRSCKRELFPKSFKVIVFLFCVVLLSCFEVAAFAQRHRHYLPYWSVKQNGGSIPFGVLTPLEVGSQGNKSALILIHGTVSDFREFCGWKPFLNKFQEAQYAPLREKYKLYLFRYPSNARSWDALVDSLKTAIAELMKAQRGKNTELNFVVASLGGDLLCDAISTDPSISSHLKRVISLGSPFNGVPLTDHDLVKSEFDRFLSASNQALFPVLDQRLQWHSHPSTSQCHKFKNKFVNYAAYIDSPLTQSAEPEEEAVEKWLWGRIVQGDYRLIWSGLLHYKVGWQLRKELPPFLRFNDGIVTVESALYLPRDDFLLRSKTLDTDTLKYIHKLNPNARLFPGIDHTELFERQANDKVFKDILSGEQKKSIAEFVLQDLQR